MTLLQSLAQTVSGQPRNSGIESPLVPLSSPAIVDWLTGPPAGSGVTVNDQTVLGIPAVWRAVTLTSGVSASLPLHAYKREGRKRLQMDSGQAADLLSDPHPDMTDLEFWELMYGSLLLWGNAYALKLRDALGVLRELWWVAPSRVKTGRSSIDGSKVYTLDQGSGDETGHTDRTMLHIPGFGNDGTCGVSPVRAAREGFGLALAAEQYGARFFGSGNLATGILQTEQRLTISEADEVKAQWEATGGIGMSSAHRVRVLGSGSKFQPLSIPNDDAQFLESRQFQISEIARMFGVPNHLLMDVTGSTSWGTGIEQQTLGWVTFGLRPWLTRVERRLTKLLRPGNVYVKYALEGLLRGDSAARSAFYNQLWQIGVLSTNDIRELEDLDPVTGGDVRYRPLNMGELGKPNPAPAAPAAPAEPDPARQDDNGRQTADA